MLSLFNRQTLSLFPRQSSVALFSTTSLNLVKQTKKAAATVKDVKKPKKEKSPVKRVVGAYSYFTKESWETRKPELTKLSTFTEKAKHINALWKNLTAAEKEKYTKMAERDIERYKKELSDYEATLGPKKPSSSYLRYALENLKRVQKENPSYSFGEISKLQGENWRSLSESEKKVYKDAYHQELAEWKAQTSKA